MKNSKQYILYEKKSLRSAFAQLFFNCWVYNWGITLFFFLLLILTNVLAKIHSSVGGHHIAISAINTSIGLSLIVFLLVASFSGVVSSSASTIYVKIISSKTKNMEKK